ncbi:MAG: ABC transporter substrate-binding protein [Desulfatiglans sp.]|jgi:ABC-type branched-subunit amino acid transport system substrate-binding protein|nr:ABC transporter substrate-binding protein [Desulfatiglans sp.]
MKKTVCFLLCVLLVFCISLGLAISESSAAEDKVVRIISLPDMTGMYSVVWVGAAFDALDTVIRETNEKGGIKYHDPVTNKTEHVKIKHVWEDTGGKVDRSLSIFKRHMNEPKTLTVLGLNSLDAEAIKPVVKEVKIPALWTACSLKMHTPPEWVFSPISSIYSEQMYALLDWMKRHGLKSIATIGWNAGASWSWHMSLKYFAPQFGIEVIEPMEILPFVPMDTSIQLRRIKSKKPDVIFPALLSKALVQVLKDSYKLGLMDRVVLAANGIDAVPIKMAGEKKCNGVRGQIMGTMTVEDVRENPGVLKADEIVKKHYPRCRTPLRLNLGGWAGWSISEVAIQAVKMALEEVGYEKVNGQAVYDVLTSGVKLDTLFTKPVVLSKDVTYGAHFGTFGQWRDGDFHRLEDWRDYKIVTEKEHREIIKMMGK